MNHLDSTVPPRARLTISQTNVNMVSSHHSVQKFRWCIAPTKHTLAIEEYNIIGWKAL